MIKNNKNEKVKKFIKVKLYGEKLNIVNTPSKKGAKKITKNLLFNRLVKLNLKSFFQFYSFYSNLDFLYDHNLSNVKVREPKLYQIL